MTTQAVLKAPKAARSNFIDSFGLGAPSPSVNKAPALAPARLIRSQAVVTAKSSSPASDTNVATAPNNEPSAMARIFGWSSSTPKAPALLQGAIPLQAAVVPQARDEANLGTDSMAALSDALAAVGIDAKGLGFQYSEQPVYYPGGSYVNKVISAKINGETENFGAALVLKNPTVTVTEILRFFGRVT